MQKPRPKQAPAPDQQRPTRDDRASTKGASAPLVVPRGENTVKQAQHPTPNSTKPPVNADPIGATTPDSGPAVIVFGRNAYGIPQAAWFPASEADLATRAARMMGLRVLKAEDETHRALAARLRQGQVYAADQTFAPAVVREVFDALSELARSLGAASPLDVTAESAAPTTRPASWDDIRVGNLVIAQESPEDGWWEAVVVALEGETLVLRWRDYARQPCVRRGRLG